MNAAEAIRVAGEFQLQTLLPIHYEGWKHFRQGRSEVERAFADAGIENLVRWPRAGEAETIEA